MFGRILLIALVATFLAWSVLTHTVDGAGPAQVYVVQPGDTLWSIASARYAGDPREGVWKLQRRNHLAGTTISPGQRLVIPSG
jgi:LysM repeat protein